ncbi:o-succinylbenzoate synthase [Mesonia mobilis]|uniref:O-succinylbenzoate synthase n=1 Tax=Mesonia mobilis TaxID=369791 RepID=A0ABQ3C2J4_9FLAO|nr:o-succinylbenzoate synthase [Mesonia mobilis]MBQ0737230.1 o-succinylbenzoate synthase [Aquimarina celericrescens]GGZ63496.1 o-succinylbenzoate synthase [Mesonia mobilis]
MKASYKKYTLNFKRPSGTSRGVLTTKETWFLILEEENNFGIGECGILRTLSIDDRPDYEEKLKWTCQNIHLPKDELLAELVEFPSIQFGVEMALLSLQSQDPFQLFPSAFTNGEKGIPINGLIWMGEETFMHEQIQQKLEQGFSCIKLKIGAIDFDKEIALLQSIRKKYSASEIELRVDANGAFQPQEALQKLQRLSELDLHSIEQPIKQGQFSEMAKLCAKTPLPIALDEELIGVFSVTKKEELLQTIQPQYIILKPSLIGGFKGTQEWIDLAEKQNIGWWITSALESNIGLNAISQFTFMQNSNMPQGLGTGSLYTNNIESPLEVKGEYITYAPEKKWDVNSIL